MIGYVLVSFLTTNLKRKKIGDAVVITQSVMSKSELLFACLRGMLSILAAVIVYSERYIDNVCYLTAVMCFAALYAGYLLFPVFCWRIFQGEIGVYENGIFAYDGILEYSKMKEYEISKNKNPDGQAMTVYCKSTFPVAFNIRHFDIDNREAGKIDAYFRKKHRQLEDERKEKQKT